MHILITNYSMQYRGGTELYTKELSIGLKKNGIDVSIFTPGIGEVATGIKDFGIPIYDDINQITSEPNLIHGHHHIETILAIMRFPKTPAIYLCHGKLPWQEMSPIHPNIVQYYAASELISSHMRSTGVSEDKEIKISSNWADTDLFKRKEIIKTTPTRALIVCNAYYDVSSIEAACQNAGISLKCLGYGFGCSSKHLNDEFKDADIVFAIGRTAIEAMAVGCAVIPASGDGAAALVDTANFEEYKRYNFALHLLRKTNLSPEFIKNEIEKYTATEVRNVTSIVRNNQSLTKGIDLWIKKYEEHISADFIPNLEPMKYIPYLIQLSQLLRLGEQEILVRQSQLADAQTALKKTQSQLKTTQSQLQQAHSQILRNILK